jgi:hypothetical protein
VRRLMTNIGAVLTAIALAVTMANGQGNGKAAAGGGGGTAKNPALTIGFSGQAGDGLLGDALGNYVGGGSVLAEMQPNGSPAPFTGFANMLLNITGGKRYFMFNYPSTVSAGCDGLISPPSPSRTNYKYGGWLNVHSVGAIAIGEVRAVGAFLGSPDGEMGYTNMDQPNNAALCSTPVAVYRSAWNSWTISTDITRLGLTSTQLAAMPTVQNCHSSSAGDFICEVLGYRGLDAWSYTNGGPVWRTPMGYNQLGWVPTFRGNYEMSWAITVTTTDTRMKANYVRCEYQYGCSFPY